MTIKHWQMTLCALALTAGMARSAAAQVQGTQDNTAYGGASGEFLLLGAGARGVALGGAFAALTTDATATYYNPAGLAQIPSRSVMISSYKYVAGTSYAWAGVAFPVGGGSKALGFSLGSFGFSDQPIYTVDNPDGDGRTYSVRETFISATAAQNFSDRFSAGLTFKVINDRLGTARGSAFAIDFGTNFHATVGDRPIRAAFVIQNLGSNMNHQGADLDVGVTRAPPLGTVDVPQEPQQARLKTTAWTLPTTFRVAVAFDVFSQGQNRVSVLGEFDQPNFNKAAAGGGLEWSMTNIGNSGFSLAARGSYSLQPDNKSSDLNFNGLKTAQRSGTFTSDGFAVGGGLSYAKGRGKFGFDYAYRNMGALGGTNFVSFTIGW